jgi:ABC-2 type transport system ATP-binding protein
VPLATEVAVVATASGWSPVRDGDTVIALDRITRRFGDVTALDHLDLHVRRGEVVGLLGHNGAGKTTTVRVVAGLLATDAGSARVLGADPLVDGAAVRARLGVLPARPIVDDRLTARGNLRFAADVFGLPREGLAGRIDAALDTFELLDRADDRVGGYSTGMRQRLGLARVLLTDPELLLLDEPTAALDPVAARAVRRTLADLARDDARTVVLCTHDLAEAELLCDRVVVLERGRVVATGSPAELTAEHGVGGLLLEVAPEDTEVARTHLGRIATGAVDREGGGRVRAAGVPRTAVPGLVRSLTAAQVTVFEVRRLEPTLEDVYLDLHATGRASEARVRAPEEQR